MYTRKQALAFARQLRTCPPPEIRNDADYSKENKYHNEICPFCSTNLKDEIDAWSLLSERYNKKFKPPALEKNSKHIRPGQIRVLDKKLCCWQKGYYYNEPVVIVLEVKGKLPDTVLVAQTWHDIYLASPCDLVVPETLRTGVDEFFIEPWNIYTLEKKYLGQCLGTAAGDVATRTLALHENPDILPLWDPRRMPLAADDPRLYFQTLEIKTGNIMKTQGADIFSFAGDSVNTLIAKIKKVKNDVKWFWQPETIKECFALLRFSPESLALYASDKDRKEIIAPCFCLEDGKIKTVNPVECLVFHEKSSHEGYAVS